MNSFGINFRVQVFGESHGKQLGVIIDGCPPGLSISNEDFENDLDRRKGREYKTSTPREEFDKPNIVSGCFNGYSTGAPLTIIFENNNTRSKDYEAFRKIPRPGHSDWVAEKKFNGYQDYRGGGHFSGRLTLALVAAGVIAKKVCKDMAFEAKVIEIAGTKNVQEGIQKAIDANDSVGGIVECRISGVEVGKGEPFFNSVESMISHLVFSIPAVKGIEFGNGFSSTRLFGSENNDSIENEEGQTKTNNAGGLSGGISNGNEIIFRVAIKPTSSTPQKQVSFNVDKKEMDEFVVEGRHDLCIALRVPVILEAAAAIVLADFYLNRA